MDRIAYVKKLNKAQKFHSIEELIEYITSLEYELENFRQQMLRAILLYLKNTIKSKYGTQQDGWPSSKNPTPLYKTGVLRQSVKYETTANGGTVFLDSYHGPGLSNETLGMIHEYGAGNIPARPIWQPVAEKEFPQIEALLSQLIDSIF